MRRTRLSTRSPETLGAGSVVGGAGRSSSRGASSSTSRSRGARSIKALADRATRPRGRSRLKPRPSSRRPATSARRSSGTTWSRPSEAPAPKRSRSERSTRRRSGSCGKKPTPTLSTSSKSAAAGQRTARRIVVGRRRTGGGRPPRRMIAALDAGPTGGPRAPAEQRDRRNRLRPQRGRSLLGPARRTEPPSRAGTLLTTVSSPPSRAARTRERQARCQRRAVEFVRPGGDDALVSVTGGRKPAAPVSAPEPPAAGTSTAPRAS